MYNINTINRLSKVLIIKQVLSKLFILKLLNQLGWFHNTAVPKTSWCIIRSPVRYWNRFGARHAKSYNAKLFFRLGNTNNYVWECWVIKKPGHGYEVNHVSEERAIHHHGVFSVACTAIGHSLKSLGFFFSPPSLFSYDSHRKKKIPRSPSALIQNMLTSLCPLSTQKRQGFYVPESSGSQAVTAR